MPPKVVRRGGAAAAARRGGRVTRSALKAQTPPPESAGEEIEKIEEPSGFDAVEAEEERVEDKFLEEDNPIDEQNQVDSHGDATEAERGSNANGVVPLKKEDEIKDSMDEYGKDERLDLDDNETEYEPEEYGGEEFEERELEQEDVHEEDEELEEEIEAEDNGGELAEDEIADGPEELESEGDDVHIGEEAERAETDDVEEEEHRDVVQERRKRKEFEIFVGGLDKGASEEDLKKVFGQVGQVTEVRLMMNPQTKKNKGFAFLRFASVEQAKRAVAELKNPVINGKQCGVTASQDSDTLFLGNISKTWTVEALREKLKHYGVENVDDITLVEDNNHVGMNRGFAFLEFSSRSDAMDAYKRLQKKDVMFGVEKPAKVSFADSFIDPGDEIMAQVKTIFVDGLSPSWNEDRVRDLLKKYGKIEKVELARNMPSAKRKDFGFVTFETHEAAVICAKAINNSELGVGEDKAKVRARLSRPLQRGGKGRHTSRSEHHSRHGSGRAGRSSWARPPRSLPSRSARVVGSRGPPSSSKKPAGPRGRRSVVPATARARPLPPPRSYDRRPPVPLYPKASLKREYGRRNDLPPPRSRAAVDYSSRLAPERHLSYRDDYTTRGSGYPDLPRSSSRSEMRRPFVDDPYSQRFERPPSYSEGRARGYEPVPGTKRPYSTMDDIPPRYGDAEVRHSRARLDYDLGPPQYGEAYGDRFARSSLGYGSSRSSMSSQDSRGLYGSRQGMGYGGGSYGGSDAGGMYSSNYGDYVSRRDVGGSSYTSVYSSRGMGGSSYSGGGPGPYY